MTKTEEQLRDQFRADINKRVQQALDDGIHPTTIGHILGLNARSMALMVAMNEDE